MTTAFTDNAQKQKPKLSVGAERYLHTHGKTLDAIGDAQWLPAAQREAFADLRERLREARLDRYVQLGDSAVAVLTAALYAAPSEVKSPVMDARDDLQTLVNRIALGEYAMPGRGPSRG